MVRFLHAADLHLGMKVTRFDPQACARIQEARFEALEKLRKQAIERDVDFLVLAGDIFDDPSVDHSTAERAFSILEGKSLNRPVFLISGNHDPLTPGGVWDRDPWRREQPTKHVRLLRESEPVPLDDWPVTLFPCPPRFRTSTDEPTAWIARHSRDPDDARIRIGLAHGSLNDRPNLPLDDHLIPPDAADRYGLDYLALGHWHRPSTHPDRDGAQRTAYSGTIEPMRFPGASARQSTGWTARSEDADDERFQDKGRGTALIVTIEGPEAPPEIETIEVGYLRWESVNEDLTQTSIGALTSQYAEREDRARTLLHLELTGVLKPEQWGRIEELRDIVERRYAQGSAVHADAVYIEPSPERLRDIVGDGVVARVLERLREEAASDDAETKQVADQALRRLYEIALNLEADSR